MSYNRQVASAVNSCLQRNWGSFQFDEDYGVFQFGSMNLKSDVNRVIKFVNYNLVVYDTSYSIRAILLPQIPIIIKKSKIKERVSDYLFLVNRLLGEGNFDFDVRNGELSFRNSIDCSKRIPSNDTIEESIDYVTSIAYDFSPGIEMMIYEKILPEEAVKFCAKMPG